MSQIQRTALITGAGQNMGLGVARHLAAKGLQVIINDIDAARAEAAAAEIISTGGKALAAPFDITKTEIALPAIAALEAEVGGIDILVNNAATLGTNPPTKLPSRICHRKSGICILALICMAYSIAPRQYSMACVSAAGVG